ncbi:UMP-CMP kinase-like [Watersipora subatra]|uniref:UMP-CMP kinase-like n=1 Tax=Watersipora subatra TaxID=2589382 RepID=UPI00355B3703
MLFKHILQRLFKATLTAMSKFNVVFVLGGPGAGKGTQCQKIVEEFGYVHLSAGDLLRAERAKEGELAEMIEGHIRNGTIVPVEVTCQLLRRAMQESCKNDFLIDGFPRNEENMSGWQKEMDDKADVKFVLFFDCPEEECVKRCIKRGLTSGRTDDNEGSTRKRIVTYNTSTTKIIDHYNSLGLVRKINAAQDADKVFMKVREVFSQR